MKTILLGATTALLLSAQAMAHEASPPGSHPTPKGEVLADAKGMTLYVFDKDQDGKSACNGPCAVSWPPLKATADVQPASQFTLVTRDDGSMQWAYRGRPLYTWIKDHKPGDTTGDGVKGTWHIAQP